MGKYNGDFLPVMKAQVFVGGRDFEIVRASIITGFA